MASKDVSSFVSDDSFAFENNTIDWLVQSVPVLVVAVTRSWMVGRSSPHDAVVMAVVIVPDTCIGRHDTDRQYLGEKWDILERVRSKRRMVDVLPTDRVGRNLPLPHRLPSNHHQNRYYLQYRYFHHLPHHCSDFGKSRLPPFGYRYEYWVYIVSGRSRTIGSVVCNVE